MNADDAGSGSVLAVGIACAVVLATGFALSLGAALSARETAVAAADAGALAGADVAAGAVGGGPCEQADRVVDADRARLAACMQRGDTVAVEAVAMIGPFTATGRAVAGPPPGALP